MFDDFLHIEPLFISGASLLSLAFYISLPKIREWLIDKMESWFGFAEQSFYTSKDEYEQTRVVREFANSFYASIFSIIPFLFVGLTVNYLLEISLGKNWGISLGILANISCGIFELGRHDNNREKE
jgi:hypothetical protein